MAKPLFDASRSTFASLAESCPVVDSAIVSKALIDTGTLKQILFSMDTGQEISEHKAPYVATVHVLEGRIRFAVSGEEREMVADDWLVMPPNERHDLTALEPSRFVLTLVKG